MATRTRTLPSWLAKVSETNLGKEETSSGARRGKQPAKRTVNKTPKKETPSRGKAVKTSPVKNLAFSESEDEYSNDTATSPKRRKDNVTDSKLAGQKPLLMSDSEEEVDKEPLKKVADEVMASNGLLHDVSRDFPISSKNSRGENNVDSRKSLITGDGAEEADISPEAVGSGKGSDNLPQVVDTSPEKPQAVSDENKWNQFEIKSSPVYEDESDTENTVATEISVNEVNSSNKVDTIGGDSCKQNSDGGNPSTDQTASTSNTDTVKRPACKYGSSCYRKNHLHLQDFSHPGDADYSTVDDRPECEYGTACYRKNPLHRQHYKHTKTPPVQNAKQTKRQKPRRHGSDSGDDSDDQGSSSRGRKKRQTRPRKTANKNDDDDEEDDYDYDDPFLNDASSDDYAPTDSGSETDFSGAQSGSGEEDDDVKRTRKEAKKFLKKRKK